MGKGKKALTFPCPRGYFARVCTLALLDGKGAISNMLQRVKGSVLVVGGGIGGMQSALDLADSGFYVYLLEQSPAIGGVMAQLDKTFPTNDCAM
jgi:heterodisulfide reductase subunit A-like polyferredoxin